MGLMSKVLGGGRGGAAVVTQTLMDAVRVVPGVSDVDLTYQRPQRSPGTVVGVVEVVDTATLVEVLRTVHRVLASLLGDGADRATFLVSGRTPDGVAITHGDLGLPQPPSGRDIARRLER